MKYTTCWQKKRMACSFKHHPRHKAVKKVWITYSVTRKAPGARQGSLSSRTRETDVLSSGGMGEPSAYAAQYMCRLLLSAHWQPKGVWTHGGKHWAVIRKCTLFLQSVLLWQLLHYLPCLLHPKQLCLCPSSLYSAEADPSLRLNMWGNWDNLNVWGIVFVHVLLYPMALSTCPNVTGNALV